MFTQPQGEQQLSIQAIRNMKQGDELCWCYSAHDNDAAWLLNYGFVPSDGVSSHPTLPPHVLAAFPSPSSGTDTDSRGSISGHDSDRDTDSEDFGSEASSGGTLGGVHRLDSQGEAQGYMDGDVGHHDGQLPEGQSAPASGTFPLGHTAKGTTVHDSRQAGHYRAPVTESVDPLGGAQTCGSFGPECEKGAVPSLVAATQHLKELEIAIKSISAQGPYHCVQGLLTLLQRERDALESLMPASVLAATT